MALSDPPVTPPAVAPATRVGWASLRELSAAHWFVFVVCCLAWDLDCMDQQLFNLARQTAVTDLTGGDPNNPDVTTFATWSTSIFLIGCTL